MTDVSPAMFSRPLVQELLRYTEWADAAVWRAVLATPAAREDDTIRNYLVHTHMVQRAFLAVWKGEPPSFTSASEFVDLDAVRAWGKPYYAEAGGYRSPDEDALGRSVRATHGTNVCHVLDRRNDLSGGEPLDLSPRAAQRAAARAWRRASARGLHRLDLVRETGGGMELKNLDERVVHAAAFWLLEPRAGNLEV